MRKNPTINFCFILLCAIPNWKLSLVSTVTTMKTSYTGISESSNSLSVTLKITVSVFSVFRKCSVKIQWSPFNFVWWLTSNFHSRFPYSVADPGFLNRARGGSPDLERGARLCSRGMSIPGVLLESPLLLILVYPILAVVLSLLIFTAFRYSIRVFPLNSMAQGAGGEGEVPWSPGHGFYVRSNRRESRLYFLPGVVLIN